MAVVLGACLAVTRMSIDIFPNLNLPVIYVAQPYGGMDPAQMEGLLTNYYEYHFLYISGIHHVESRNVQGMALMKLFFHPGTNMAQAMAETIGYVTRSRAFMPPGRSRRSSSGSTPAACPWAISSCRARPKSIGEIQDQALFKVRPMFARLPGVSAPPPVRRQPADRGRPGRSRAAAVVPISPDELITALTNGNTISPSGNVRIGKMMPIVPDQRAGPRRQGAGKHPDPRRRESRGLPPRRGHRAGRHAISPPATPWSTAAARSTSW